MTVAKKRGLDAKPEVVGDRRHIKVTGQKGQLDAILYRPAGSDGKEAPALPVLVYFHGGGFVVASADVYDTSARALANAAKCVVISVNYRSAPEHKFPAAAEDAYAALQNVIKNSAKLDIDSKRVAVGGESAGGNLATVVCLMAKERNGAMPVHQLLIYPVTDWNSKRPSHTQFALSPTLPEKNLPWFADLYLPSPADGIKPFASPINAGSFAGLPPATIINAACDVLADDGAAYAEKLQSAGIPVTHKVYAGMVHEFFGMGLVIDEAKEAEGFAAAELMKAFSSQK
jgi:acetyl esterase